MEPSLLDTVVNKVIEILLAHDGEVRGLMAVAVVWLLRELARVRKERGHDRSSFFKVMSIKSRNETQVLRILSRLEGKTAVGRRAKQ